jgi:putative ABC transport system ATP-binding protein
MSQPAFLLTHVAKTYSRGEQAVPIFDDLNMSIAAGDFIALMGPSGSGKTTLLNLLGGIDQPDAGEIFHNGNRIDDLTQTALSQWRARHCGFVFQAFNLLPMLSAARNIELPLILNPALSSARRKQQVEVALDLVGIVGCGGRLPSQLSGGQQQRVAIARAVVANTDVLLCDEPTGNLDRASSEDILSLLQLLNRELGKTIIMVTHDPVAAAAASKILHLEKGQFIDAHLVA